MAQLILSILYIQLPKALSLHARAIALRKKNQALIERLRNRQSLDL